MIVRIFRPAFTVRRSLLVVGTVVVGLAFPAVSMARLPCVSHPGTHPNPTCQIKTTPIHKGSKGFQLTLFIKQGQPTGYGARYPTSVAGILFKHNGNATENDDYTFSKGLTFSIGKSRKPLQFATIKGKFATVNRTGVHVSGSVNLAFHATGTAHKVSVPKGCKGNGGERRTGTLSGPKGGGLKLHADNFGTITQRSFKATISTAAFQCNKPTHGYDVTTLLGNPFVDVFKSSAGKVTETINDEPVGSGWAFAHEYKVTGLPGSDYNVQTTSTLKKATIKGGGGISGTPTYSSSQSSKHKTKGNVSGSFVAPFTSIGNLNAFPKSRKAEQTHS